MAASNTDNGEVKARLLAFYKALYRAFGPQGWWPGRTRFEIIVGAILTQNTSWANVEKAIRGLKKAGLLTPPRMHALGVKELSGHIRPAGYFNIKAKRIKNFLDFLFDGYGGSLFKLFSSQDGLRERFLGVNGIGPETADSIILYAGVMPEFVVDAYTRRVFSRHGFVSPGAGYEELKSLFMENLPGDALLFNEYHALLVRVGKDYCKAGRPLCGGCPLEAFL